jgi:deferrochelatase/peroxidase EfeB
LKVVVPAVWSVLRTFLWPLVVLPLLALVGKGLWSGLWAGFWWAIVTLGAELVFAVLAGGIAYLGLRHKEKTDVPDDSDPSAQAVGDIMAREDQCMQNHLAAVSPMKSGWLRRLTLRIALWGVGAFAAYHSRPGTLRNIATIHFAHWILLPGTDKLLFFSNYSGSWESYLEDFIVRGHDGLTGVWSNTQGFPRTSNLVTDGARDGDRFKRWARRQQHPTLFWYTAYPNLTTARIRINAAIRDGLVTASTEACAARWLVNFGFAPPRTATLQSDRIPILVFGGIPALHCARSLVLQIPDPPNAARDWLAKIEQQIGYGERTPARSTLVLGLSASGLRKLGLDDQTLSTFPSAFQHGMAAPWRSRALGDVGGNGPDKWAWGGPGKEADAILNVYACDEQTLDREIESPGGQRAQLNRFGIKAIYEIALDKTPPKDTPLREPFGFTDGISQPLVRGARKWVIARNRIHVVEPGEMILGYPDNFDYIPSSPSTAAGRDLGRNGTFLVVRQLEQDTAAFDDFLRKTADALMGDPRVPAGSRQQVSEWIAAKIVGRWRDGTSLVRHPGQAGSITRPGTLPDNDFLFGTEDPNGLRCPFGAHIRRVNPRETFDAGSEEQLKITNRHRIFRVGRRYGPQNGLQHPGLLFMCVNANIERQFEFMQQTYMLGSNFHGLTNEIDSFARRRGASDVLTIPTEHGPLRLRGLGSFITVQGGGYFFLPGRDTVRFLISGS